MKITILCVGKLKENYLKEAVKEYTKRLSSYANIKIIEVSDEKIPDKISHTEANMIKEKEALRLEKYLSNSSFKIALAIEGKQLYSEELAQLFSENMINGISNFTLIIGGSLGLVDRIITNCDYCLSFSKMTFPHQLMRVILLEQVYRSFKILSGEPYHK